LGWQLAPPLRKRRISAASLIAERPAQPGETITIAVLMQPDKGWHGYWC